MEKLIEEWKEKGVDRAEFEFSCGGDSMNDTSLVFFDKEERANFSRKRRPASAQGARRVR